MRIFIYLFGCLFVARASPTSETTTTVTAVAPTLTDLKTLIRQSLPESDSEPDQSPADILAERPENEDGSNGESEDESEPTITPTLKIDITEDILLHPEASLFLPKELSSENDVTSDKLSDEFHQPSDDILDKEHLKFHSHRIHEAEINESDKDDSETNLETENEEIPKEENNSEEKAQATPEMKKGNCSKVELTMESKIVENEWIILFKKYYDKGTI